MITDSDLGPLSDPNARVFVGVRGYRVIDGDTIWFDFDLGMHTARQDAVRLLDVDAYETRGEHKALGRLASGAVSDVFGRMTPDEMARTMIVMIKTRKGEKRGKYGRYLARVVCFQDGERRDLGQMLLDTGLAVPY